MSRTHVALAVACAAWLLALSATTNAQAGPGGGSSRESRPAAPASPERFGIGRAATAEEIVARDGDVMPDGTEGPNDVLVGREPRQQFSFSQDPSLPHTIGNYWPYATTVFDYIRRAMPPTAPRSLTDAEVYSLTAFLLHANELIGAEAVMDATTLPKVAMPARQHFVPDARGKK